MAVRYFLSLLLASMLIFLALFLFMTWWQDGLEALVSLPLARSLKSVWLMFLGSTKYLFIGYLFVLFLHFGNIKKNNILRRSLLSITFGTTLCCIIYVVLIDEPNDRLVLFLVMYYALVFVLNLVLFIRVESSFLREQRLKEELLDTN